MTDKHDINTSPLVGEMVKERAVVDAENTTLSGLLPRNEKTFAALA